MKTKVTIHRKDAFFNKYRDYKIFINDVFVGKISNHNSFEFEIEEKSNLSLKIDWCSSNVLTIEPKVDKVIISSSCILSSGWKILMYPLYLTLFYNKYILLQEVSSID